MERTWILNIKAIYSRDDAEKYFSCDCSYAIWLFLERSQLAVLKSYIDHSSPRHPIPCNICLTPLDRCGMCRAIDSLLHTYNNIYIVENEQLLNSSSGSFPSCLLSYSSSRFWTRLFVDILSFHSLPGEQPSTLRSI